VEDEGSGRHPELTPSVHAADPLHDEIQIEGEIAGLVPIVRVARAQFDSPDVTVMPTKGIEIRFRVNHGRPLTDVDPAYAKASSKSTVRAAV